MSPVDDARAVKKGERRPPPLLQGLPPEEDLLPQTPFQVRNTFIDMCLARSPSLERFFKEREVQTCPSARVGALRSLFQDPPEDVPERAGPAEGDAVQPPWRRAARTATRPDQAQVKVASGSLASSGSSTTSASEGHATPPLAPPATAPLVRLADATLGSDGEFLPFLVAIGGPVVPFMESPFRPHVEAGAWQAQLPHEGYVHAGFPAAPVVRRTPAPRRTQASPPAPPAAPAPGSEELPTIGSAAHTSGRCKPCAFVHTSGCSNGLTCEFCHLCDPGEKKRRRKEKLEARRAGKDMRSRRSARS